MNGGTVLFKENYGSDALFHIPLTNYPAACGPQVGHLLPITSSNKELHGKYQVITVDDCCLIGCKDLGTVTKIVTISFFAFFKADFDDHTTLIHPILFS